MMSSIPAARNRTRSGSSQRPATKGKSRANIPEDVIELTDSDNDDHTRSKKPSRNIQLGLSRSRNQLLPLASASTENMPSSNQRSSKPGKSERDEENNPPPRTSDPPPLRPDFAVEIEDVSMGQVTVEDSFQPEPEPQLMEIEQDIPSKMLAQVLEVVPDVRPDHAVELLSQQPNASPDEVVQAVIHALFEAPYPKVDRKGKRKAVDENEGQHKRARLDESDYAKLDRPYTGGVYYSDLSMVSFPFFSAFPAVLAPFNSPTRNNSWSTFPIYPSHTFERYYLRTSLCMLLRISISLQKKSVVHLSLIHRRGLPTGLPPKESYVLWRTPSSTESGHGCCKNSNRKKLYSLFKMRRTMMMVSNVAVVFLLTLL